LGYLRLGNFKQQRFISACDSGGWKVQEFGAGGGFMLLQHMAEGRRASGNVWMRDKTHGAASLSLLPAVVVINPALEDSSSCENSTNPNTVHEAPLLNTDTLRN
jgi:hypothetical protein